MTTIHMETEQVKGVSRRLENASTEMFEETQRLNTALNALYQTWENPVCQEFSQAADRIVIEIQRASEACNDLAVRLQREVEEWEAADKLGADSISGTSSRTAQKGLVSAWFWSGWFGGGDKNKNQTPLSDLAKDINNTTSGGELLEQAKKNKLTFLMPDGKKYGYTGKGGSVVKVNYGDSGEDNLGCYVPSDKEITISKGMLFRDAEGVLAHEMQHAMDDKLGLFVKEPTKANAAQWTTFFQSRLDSEERAFERGHSVETNQAFDMSNPDRNPEEIFDNDTLWGSDGYEAVYEKYFDDVTHGKEINLKWDDQQGKLTAKISNKDEDKWYEVWRW